MRSAFMLLLFFFFNSEYLKYCEFCVTTKLFLHYEKGRMIFMPWDMRLCEGAKIVLGDRTNRYEPNLVKLYWQ